MFVVVVFVVVVAVTVSPLLSTPLSVSELSVITGAGDSLGITDPSSLISTVSVAGEVVVVVVKTLRMPLNTLDPRFGTVDDDNNRLPVDVEEPAMTKTATTIKVSCKLIYWRM